MAETHVLTPDPTFIREVKRLGGDSLKKCYQCSTCSSVCNLSSEAAPFPRRQMLSAGWGDRDALVSDPRVWLCHQCNDCSTYCPRGARPGDVLASIRAFAYRHFSFPSFMGSALSKPGALPVLILVPVLILAACIFAFAPQLPTGEFEFLQSSVIDFNLFLPHSSVDALFVFGNILIFIFAAVGFVRFWKAMRAGSGEPMQKSFISGLVGTIGEILSHRSFNKCEANNARTIGHLLLLYGFIGAMITTGAVFVAVFIPHYLDMLGVGDMHGLFAIPFNLPNPVKILGAASGVAMLIGSGWLIIRRWTNADDVGANGYTDYLFLYVIFVAALTGMTSWLFRWGGAATAAYASYFVHIVSVFFLLWYMPYSKFAHMIYRTLALTHARCVGRW